MQQPSDKPVAARRCRATALACALAGAGVGLLALGGRVAGYLPLAGGVAGCNPMAASTAVMTLLFGSALALHLYGRSRFAAGAAPAAALVVAFWGLAGLLDGLGLTHLRLDDLLRPGVPAGDVTTNAMSPVTAITCLLAGVALLLLLAAGRRAAGAIAALTSLVALLSLLVLLCYLEDNWTVLDRAPFQYEIRMAVPTALGWLLLGVALVAATGPQHLFVQPLLGPSTHALLLRAFLPLTAAAVLLTGVLHSLTARHLHDLLPVYTALLTVAAVGVAVALVHRAARGIADRFDRLEAARLQALEEVRRARDLAEANDRAKGEFLAHVCHEMRTPLTTVQLGTEDLQESAEVASHPELLEVLGLIYTEEKRLLRLINDLLDLGKIEAGKLDLTLKSVAVAEVVRDVAGTIGPLAAARGNALDVRAGEDLGTMRTDAGRLHQCLVNLLSNANKFTDKGTVTLAVSRDGRDGDDWVTFRVTDTGVGMTPEQLGRLFQPYAQVGRLEAHKKEGIGLGLFITRKLCGLMGGSVSAESAPGRGSTFIIRLPSDARRRGAEAEARAARPQAGAPAQDAAPVLGQEAVLKPA